MFHRTSCAGGSAGRLRDAVVLGVTAFLLWCPGDAPAGGFCTSSSQCDDGNPCTKDSCGASNLCSHTQKNCDDLDPCTVDSCAAQTGECVNKEKTCVDLDPCTNDGCSRSTGECTHTQKVCVSSNPCQVDGYCSGGSCFYDSNDCYDGSECTSDLCDPVTGCYNPPSVDCDDEDPCTIDFCKDSDGECINEQMQVCPTCGDPSADGKVATTDALIVLRSSVGNGECNPCLCDVNSNAMISSSDALIILRIAVDQPIVADCPEC